MPKTAPLLLKKSPSIADFDTTSASAKHSFGGGMCNFGDLLDQEIEAALDHEKPVEGSAIPVQFGFGPEILSKQNPVAAIHGYVLGTHQDWNASRIAKDRPCYIGNNLTIWAENPEISEGKNALDRALEAGRKILKLKDNWDGEGSVGYAKATYNRTEQFLRKHEAWLLQKVGEYIPTLEIEPGPEGSIDLHWKTPKYELLVNIPVDETAPASFYGDDYKKNAFKGTFPQDETNEALILWLKEMSK